MCMPKRVCCVVLFVSMPTYLVSDGERGVEPVVLDDGAASLRGADGADVRHAQGVAGVVAAEVLGKDNTAGLACFKTCCFLERSDFEHQPQMKLMIIY